MRDLVLSILAFLVLVGFIGVLIWKLPRLDLTLVSTLTVVLTAYDFFAPRIKFR
jgi:hypothetical protein